MGKSHIVNKLSQGVAVWLSMLYYDLPANLLYYLELSDHIASALEEWNGSLLLSHLKIESNR